MATLCTHCGTALKDDACYCKICGTLVPSHPFSPATAFPSAGKSEACENTTAAKQEQNVASFRQLRSTPTDEPPAWMAQLERDVRKRSGSLSERQTKAPAAAEAVQRRPQEDYSPAAPLLRPDSPVRELHVKVWDQNEPVAAADDIEDRPTLPLLASSSEAIVQRNSTPSPEPCAQEARVDELERYDTVRLALLAHARPAVQESQEQAAIAPEASVQELSQTPPPQSSLAPLKRWESRKPLLIVLIALVVLVVGGAAGAWIVIYQPFTVPAITQPQHTFSDQRLGLALLYPSGWQAQTDRGSAAEHFFDSSHTAQVNIVVSPIIGGDVSQYAQQEAAQIGLSEQKAGPALTIAGESWWQLQGSMQLRGANYSAEMLVTPHHSRLFTILFLAPQAVFAQEDRLVFSEIRSSLQFLA